MNNKIDPSLVSLRNRIKAMVDADHWEATRFLSIIKKKFNNLIAKIDQSIEDQKPVGVPELSVDQKLVYVSLYHRKGRSLEDWEGVLRTFSSIAPGRNVYKVESGVATFILKSNNTHQQAYVELAIKDSDIITPSKVVPEIIFASRETILKPSAFAVENIRRFVHMGQSYTWQSGQLARITDVV